MGQKKKNKLELSWVDKHKRPKLEPRILLEEPDLSYHANVRHSEDDIFDNMVIQGDNLLALKSLENEYAGEVKCIFIDPPYNTGSAFEHYEDGLEHSIWLGLMRDRLEILKNLLSDDGSIFVCIDYNEVHYLKILMDEIFGRKNFQREIIWRIGWLSGFKTKANNFIRNHDTILYYSKNKESLFFNKKYIEKKDFSPRFNNESIKEIKKEFEKRGLSKADAKEMLTLIQEIGLPDRYPIEDTWNSSVYDRLNSIAVVSFSGESVSKMLGVEDLKGQKSEALIHRIFESATEPGDLVLDSFAGTGTTAAVAHKMGRRWIAVEIGEHARTHIVPRLKLVIDGTENSGVTKKTNWKGGGGFRFYHLAPSLLEKDHYGNWIISKEHDANMLSQAICKIVGFVYDPSEIEYWQHGYSSESDFIFVTTNVMTHDSLNKLSDEVGPDRTLLIYCKAFDADVRVFTNLTIKKIPLAILAKCEWGKDDYSKSIKNLPMFDIDDNEGELLKMMEGDNAGK